MNLTQGPWPPANPPQDQLARMREEAIGNIPFEPTDDQLRHVWRSNPDLVGLAYAWSWSDTEVRDELCAALEKLHEGEDS